MVLNARKIKILEAIIDDYVQTAEPIGSRTIAKKYDLGISSATIRNEMSDLEEMGYIIQPHASSGRVPSDKGYRFYVDRLANYRDLTEEEIIFLREMIYNNIHQIDHMMQETAKAISLLTNYTTIAAEPQLKKTKVKHVQLAPLDEQSIVLLLVTDSKAVKNQIIHMAQAPDYETLGKMSERFNHVLQGCSLENIEVDMVKQMIGMANVEESVFLQIIQAIVDTIRVEDSRQIYTSGVKNLLAYPEFSDLEKTKLIFQTLEERDLMITLLDQEGSENIQVVIGMENSLEQMKDCSIIKANYILGGQNLGSIGIIGPTRMHYSQVVSILNGIVKNVNAVLKALTGG